ncbi:SDR family NAD(P)-dependent oxidoreductase, partial [Vibrio parahaemolyticus]
MYQNKVVVITGGSQGIGQYLTQAYLDLQAKVIVFDIAPNKNPE